MPNPTFVITMADGREMKGELYPDIAPQSVGNFIALANSGFYDGLIFHRVIPGFMIQGGDPKGTGMGGPGYRIKGEFAMNGVNNPLKHTYGVLSMARSMMPDSAGSQFFIMTSDSPHLDGQYAAFGKVLEGMDVADAIVSVKRDRMDKPLEPQTIKSIRVETFGQTYPFEQMQGSMARAWRKSPPAPFPFGGMSMDKQKTTVRVAGREYTLVSSDSPEYIGRVAAYVDRKINEAALAAHLPVDKAAVLVALNIADELMRAHDENSRLRRELMALRQEH